MAKDGEEVIQRLKEREYECILLDLKLPKVDGISVLREARAIHPEAVVIAMTGYNIPKMIREVKDLSVHTCLKKPINPRVLLRHLEGITFGTRHLRQ
jgi:CheY-like chemotaxis protein